MAFAASSVRLTASGVEMSGLRAPLRTATATATVASGVALPVTTWPEARTSGYGGWMIGTSNGSPVAACCLVPPPEPNVGLTLWPVFLSNSGIIFSISALMPPGAPTETSPAPAIDAVHRMATATADEGQYFMMLLYSADPLRRLSANRS